MLSLDQLLEHIAACQSGRVSLDDFEDWFRSNSRGSYRASESVSRAAAAVEAAFSKWAFQGLDECGLREELGVAVRPFVEQREQRVLVYGKPRAERTVEPGILRRPLFLLAFVVV